MEKMEINLEEENREILRRYRALLRVCHRSKTRHERGQIRKAFEVSLEAHKDMRRKSGEPYIYHPLAVAKIAAEELGLDTLSILCALCCTTPWKTPTLRLMILRIYSGRRNALSLTDSLKFLA